VSFLKNPRNYPHKNGTPRISACPVLPESRVAGLHYCHWSYASISFQISVVGSERHTIRAVECGTAIQGHPRALILIAIESAPIRLTSS